MIRRSTCNVFHIPKFCIFFYRVYDLIRLMYDDAFLADRLRYQFTMFRFPVLVGLSPILHAHIAYETDTAKINAAFC